MILIFSITKIGVEVKGDLIHRRKRGGSRGEGRDRIDRYGVSIDTKVEDRGNRSVQGRAKAISIGTPRQRERRRDVQSITRDPAAMLVALISAVIHSKHF